MEHWKEFGVKTLECVFQVSEMDNTHPTLLALFTQPKQKLMHNGQNLNIMIKVLRRIKSVRFGTDYMTV